MGGGCGQPPVPSCRMTPANGGGQPRGWPTATSPQAIATPHLDLEQTTSSKKKRFFFRTFPPLRPRTGPDHGRPEADGARTMRSLIAQ